MSTKVYVAYRTKPGVDIWKLSTEIHAKARRRVQQVLRTEYARLLEASVQEKSLHQLICDRLRMQTKTTSLTTLEISAYVHRCYGDQLSSGLRDHWDLSVSIALRKDGNRWYLIPYADGLMRSVLSFLSRQKGLENYAYWDNVDRPRGISDAEWEARGRQWDKLDARWQEMLVLEVLSYSGFMYVDPAYPDTVKASKLRRKAQKSAGKGTGG